MVEAAVLIVQVKYNSFPQGIADVKFKLEERMKNRFLPFRKEKQCPQSIGACPCAK
jgi:hypothetical protein